MQCGVFGRGVAVLSGGFFILGPDGFVADGHVQHAGGFELADVLGLGLAQNHQVAKKRVLVSGDEVAVAELATAHRAYES